MPMDKCGKCEQNILQQKDRIKCADCSICFHISCSRNTFFDTTNRISTRTSYKCASDNSSANSRTGPDHVAWKIASVLKGNC